MKAEVRELLPQAKGRQIPPQTTRNQEKGWEHILLTAVSTKQPTESWMSDVGLQNWDSNLLFFS